VPFYLGLRVFPHCVAVGLWRRALRLQYGKFRITPALTYQAKLESHVASGLAHAVLSAGRPLLVSPLCWKRIGRSFQNINQQSPIIYNLGLSAADALASIVFTPLLISRNGTQAVPRLRWNSLRHLNSSGTAQNADKNLALGFCVGTVGVSFRTFIDDEQARIL